MGPLNYSQHPADVFSQRGVAFFGGFRTSCGSRNVSTRLWTHASPSSWQGIGAATAPDPRPWQGPRRQVVYAFRSRGHPVVRAFRRFPYTAQRVLGRFPYTTLRERARPSGLHDVFRTRPGTEGATGLCTLAAMFGRDFVHWPSRGGRLCTLATPFRGDFVHWGRPPLYKPPPEYTLQCAKSRCLRQTSRSFAGHERLAHPPRTHTKCRSLPF